MSGELKLKPCPFCGGKAYLQTWSYDRTHFEVGCENKDDTCLFAPSEVAPSEDAAALAWNTRSTK